MFSCELYKVFKTIYFTEYLHVTVSVFVSFSEILIKRLSEWFSSISETVAANLVSKSFGCHNRYQHIVN